MLRVLALLVLPVLALDASGARAQEQAPKANCKLFKRSSDGRWISTVDSKVGNPQSFVLLQAGKPIERSMTVLGNNISDTIDRLCGP